MQAIRKGFWGFGGIPRLVTNINGQWIPIQNQFQQTERNSERNTGKVSKDNKSSL